MTKVAAGFAAAYLLAALYFGAFFYASGAVKPESELPMMALGWPLAMAPIFWRDDLWMRNRPAGCVKP